MQLRDYFNKVYFGDCVKSLRSLPAGFVHTCVTSPPYFGLRDYGSGRWEGGDPSHDHGKEVGTKFVGRNDGDRYGEGTHNFTGQKKTARAERPNPRTSPTIGIHRDVSQHEAHDVQKLKRVAQCSCGAVYVDEQIGQEQTPEEYIANLVNVFREVRRVLRDDGTIWVNLGDSYATQELPGGIKPKDLIGIPWMFAFAMRADGWWLRNDVIWHKPSVMPESIKDRCTKAHEFIFLMSKSEQYYFDHKAIMEPAVSAGSVQKFGGGNKNRAYAMGREPSGNERPDAPPITIGEKRHKRDVWTVNPKPYSGAHFAVYPEELIEPCVLAGSPERGVVLDPFIGSGTTAAVAARLTRYWVGCELNDSNAWLQAQRLGRTWTFDEDRPRKRVRLDEGGRVRI